MIGQNYSCDESRRSQVDLISTAWVLAASVWASWYQSIVKAYYSGIFYFCQYLHIGAGILSFGGDVFRL